MAWKAHPKFKTGQYKAVVEALLDSSGPRKTHIVSLIGSLSFLGRLEEAADLYELIARKSKDPVDRVASRFFLAIGRTRRSEYSVAEALFRENEKEAGSGALERFFVFQGKAFFAYYTGRLALSLQAAQESLKWALASRDLLARRLATDALGIAQVGVGEIHSGLAHLREAQALAEKLGNKGSAEAIRISRLLCQWEYGLTSEPIEELEKLARESAIENTYSYPNLLLELARQFTLKGKFAKSAYYLELAAPAIYASHDRRKEILLNLRLAELAGRKGDFFQARHSLHFSRRLLHREVDSSFELAALGIERKLCLAQGKDIRQLDERWEELKDFSSTRDRNLKVRLGRLSINYQNPEDRVHEILRLSRQAANIEDQLAPLLEAGYLSEASLVLGLNPGQNTVAVLPRGLGLFVQHQKGLDWQKTQLSSLQRKLLKSLSSGRNTSKEELVKAVWGYAYSPLRHDGMVYVALSSLRKLLGEAGTWLQPTENGYVFEAAVTWPGQNTVPQNEEPVPVAPELAADLNHRQIEILECFRTARFLSVSDCRKKFAVSEITALRDLDGLRQKGYVVRIGKARATRYGLAKGEQV